MAKDDAEAFRWVSKAAEQDCSLAWMTLGAMYDAGRGVPADREKGFKLYLKAAEDGEPLAQRFVGLAYQHGLGVKADAAVALKWFRQAAEQGDTEAATLVSKLDPTHPVKETAGFGVWVLTMEGTAARQYQAKLNGLQLVVFLDGTAERAGLKSGDILMEVAGRETLDQPTLHDILSRHQVGETVAMVVRRGGAKYKAQVALERQRSLEEALRQIPQMAERGDAWACLAMHQKCKDNPAEAAKWCRKAAELGHFVGQMELAVMYEKGSGVPQDKTEAYRWYRCAAEQGFALAQYVIARVHYLGDGVVKDLAEAARWFRLAAEQGDPDAQNELGSMYAKGQGVAQDDAEAAKWYRRCAEQDDPLGQDNLGLAYLHGKGVPQDYREAFQWFRRSANQGHAAGQCDLGICYHNGCGVPQDDAEAVLWLKKAARQGYAEALARLKDVGGMDPSWEAAVAACLPGSLKLDMKINLSPSEAGKPLLVTIAEETAVSTGATFTIRDCLYVMGTRAEDKRKLIDGNGMVIYQRPELIGNQAGANEMKKFLTAIGEHWMDQK